MARRSVVGPEVPRDIDFLTDCLSRKLWRLHTGALMTLAINIGNEEMEHPDEVLEFRVERLWLA